MFTTQLTLEMFNMIIVLMNYTAPLSISYPWKSEFHSRVGSTCDEYKIDLRWALSTSENQDNNDTDVDFADGDDVESDDLDEYVDDDGDDDLGQWLSTKRWLGMILWRSKPRR